MPSVRITLLTILSLHPDSVHLRLRATINLEALVYVEGHFLETCLCKELVQLFLCEEVSASAIATHIEVVSCATARLEAQLRHIIATIVTKEQHATGLEIRANRADHRLHSVKRKTFIIES